MSSIGERRGKSRVELIPVVPIEPPERPWRTAASVLTPPAIILIAGSLFIAPALPRLHPGWPWPAIKDAVFALMLLAVALATFGAWRMTMRSHRDYLAGGDGDPR